MIPVKGVKKVLSDNLNPTAKSGLLKTNCNHSEMTKENNKPVDRNQTKCNMVGVNEDGSKLNLPEEMPVKTKQSNAYNINKIDRPSVMLSETKLSGVELKIKQNSFSEVVKVKVLEDEVGEVFNKVLMVDVRENEVSEADDTEN